jgi:phage baseplate assembly protein W
MSINWSPTTAEEVVQNVRTLLVTAPGTVPLSRELGTPQDVVDLPQSAAGARLQADVIRAVRTYEPRAEIKSVVLTSDGVDGALNATATMVGVP